MKFFVRKGLECCWPKAGHAASRFSGILVAALCALAIQASACSELPAGTSFWVRLTTPVSSYNAKPGMPVHGFLLESPECDDAPVLPMRVPVEGQVVTAHRVGLGLRRETATLEIDFLRFSPDGAAPIEIRSKVKLLDNARESVKNGVIHGIVSTDTPQGRISSRLKYLPSWHLYPDPFLLGFKMLFPVFPEPEIYLAPGTDVEAVLAQPVKLPGDLPSVEPVPALQDESELTHDLNGLPERTFTKKGKEADVINLVFVGSQSDLEQAFQAAGWKQSESVSKHSVMHQFHAFLAKTNYATAPMSAQWMDGRTADLTLEKTFDSYGKRNHLRIWQLEKTWEGEPLWASAAVRETGATLSVRHKGFMHHVSEDVAEEQHVVIRDLEAAGCVDAVGAIARPDMEHMMQNATGEFFRTDGTLEVVRLKPCQFDLHGSGYTDAPQPKPGSRPFRYVRRQILTVRGDLLRANIIYSLFDVTRISVKAFRQNSSHRAEEASFRQENHRALTSAPPQSDTSPHELELGP